jgi:hypothetical protein
MKVRKKFVFRLENTPVYYIVMHLLAIFIAHGAFKNKYKSIEQIFRLEISLYREELKLDYKDKFKTTPIFRDFEKIVNSLYASGSKACPYYKYRDRFVWLG